MENNERNDGNEEKRGKSGKNQEKSGKITWPDAHMIRGIEEEK